MSGADDDSSLGTHAQRGGAAEPPRRDDEAALAAGTVLSGRYRIVRALARGGMGEVYEAEHVDLKKRVAVKVMLPSRSKDSDFVARFKREAIAASRIGHLNIVDVSDFGVTGDERFYFVMELLDGRTLGALVRDGPFDWRRAVHVMLQVGRALTAAHDRGIVHRDLKPENVMLLQRPGQTDLVKVLDFGIAKVTEADTTAGITHSGVVIGTPQYMSPEQAAGLTVDARSDVYSLGLIFYELLAGRPAFEGVTAPVVMAKQMTSLPAPLTQAMPDGLRLLVSELLAKDPQERPQTMAAVVARLDPFVHVPEAEARALPAPAAALPRGDTISDDPPRWPKVVGFLAAAFVLAAAAGAAIAAWFPREPAQQPQRPQVPTEPVRVIPGPLPGELSCTSGVLFAGNPLHGNPVLRPADGTGLLEDPPFAFRTVLFSGGQLITHNGQELWRASLTDGKLHRFAGLESTQQASIAGPCAQARFANVFGLALASDGSLFVSDETANAVLKVTDPLGPGCRVHRWAGTPSDVQPGKLSPVESPNLGDADGPGAKAKFRLPERLATDPDDNVYVWDAENEAIRKIASDAAHTVSTLATHVKGVQLTQVFLGGRLYVWGRETERAFLFALAPDGTRTDLLHGGPELFGGRRGEVLQLGGIVTDGVGLVVFVDGQLFRIDTKGEVRALLAGTRRPGTSFSRAYDPRARHAAGALELVTTSGLASSAGVQSFLAIDASHSIYLTAHADDVYVEKIECGH